MVGKILKILINVWSLISSDVSRTFPDREFPGKFNKSQSRDIFLHSREFREIQLENNTASLELI